MIGRAEERAVIERLLGQARSRRSGALAITGEPGVGKSTLLAHAVELAGDMRVLKAAGVETEVDLPFAALDQLLRPVLPLATRLPPPQASALLGALGRVEHIGDDRFLIGAATLALLSEAAEESPVLCVLDDAQWVDGPSAEALVFAARRMEAEGIVLLVAARERSRFRLPELAIGGLDPAQAAELLREHAGDLAVDVRDRLVEETGGNPLALIELAGTLASGQLAGAEPLPRSLPITSRVTAAFADRARTLPAESRTLLLVATADDTGDPAVVFRAAAELGAGPEAMDAIEREGLARVDTDGRFTFRHPLVRASVYHSATFSARLAAHRALANALDGDEHIARRAWHLAAAAIGPDEHVAVTLEHAGTLARRRGGYAVASAAFERAAELSAGRADRARRVVAAARAAFRAGQADRAVGLAARAEPLVAGDAEASNELNLLRGRLEFARGSAVLAHRLLLDVARHMAERDPRGAIAVLAEAARAAWNAYDEKRYAEVVDRLGELVPREGAAPGPVVATAIAIGRFMAGPPRDAVPELRRAIDGWIPLVAGERTVGHDEQFIEASFALAGVTRIVGDDEAGLTLGRAAVAECRAQGLVAWLPWALVNLSMTEAVAGRHSDAAVNGSEALRLARDLDLPTTTCGAEANLAWLCAVRGEEARCRELATDALELAGTHHLAGIAVTARWALGLLELSLGRPEPALEHLLATIEGPHAVPSVKCLVTPDLLESAVRAGRERDLQYALDWFAEWAFATGQPVAAAAVHRCRALLDDRGAEERFREALRLHEEAGPAGRPFDRARTHLLYGQWLRRSRRRTDARDQLALAYQTFERLGARPWADRAAAELRATGQTVSRGASSVNRLTPQELQVVRLVAAGASNQDAAAHLFLSPRTVAYHLYKAYPKLGVTSRTELARLDLDAVLSSG